MMIMVFRWCWRGRRLGRTGRWRMSWGITSGRRMTRRTRRGRGGADGDERGGFGEDDWDDGAVCGEVSVVHGVVPARSIIRLKCGNAADAWVLFMGQCRGNVRGGNAADAWGEYPPCNPPVKPV